MMLAGVPDSRVSMRTNASGWLDAQRKCEFAPIAPGSRPNIPRLSTRQTAVDPAREMRPPWSYTSVSLPHAHFERRARSPRGLDCLSNVDDGSAQSSGVRESPGGPRRSM